MWPCSLLDCRLCPYHRGVWSFSTWIQQSESVRRTPRVTRSIPFLLWVVRCAKCPPAMTPPLAPTVGRWPSWRQMVLAKRRINSRNGGIELARLNGSVITGARTLHPSGTMVGGGFSNLSWSADSQTLSFDQLDPSSDVTSSWLLSDPNAKSSLASAVEIPLHPKGLTWGGFLGRSAMGEPMGIGVQTAVQDEPPLASSQEVVSIDPQTGAVVRTLFELPAAICTSSSPSAPEDCDADFTNTLDVAPSGSNVLVSGAIPLKYGQVSTSGVTYLFRWDTSSAKPVRLTSGVLVAAWGPGPAATSSESH